MSFFEFFCHIVGIFAGGISKWKFRRSTISAGMDNTR